MLSTYWEATFYGSGDRKTGEFWKGRAGMMKSSRVRGGLSFNKFEKVGFLGLIVFWEVISLF